MSVAFADTSFYLALLSPQDNWHTAALKLSASFRGRVLTSEYVLFELGALMCRAPLRQLFLELIRDLESAPHVEIISASRQCFKEGLKMFASRSDKDWSLTDCVSFVLMQRHNIMGAFTSDHHFEQAGFQVLLKQ